MFSETAVSVKNICKCFEIYDKPFHRLWQMLFAGKKRFYKEFHALKDVSFDVKRGECVGIIGRNGAGKSTLLQIITGTLQPTSGTVETYGRITALLELGSGFNPEFSGRDNVWMNAAVLGFADADIKAKYQEIVEFADIGDFIDQPVKTYSSGMMVRLAFAVQVMLDPDILIVDEALSVGDMFFQQKCLERLKKLLDRGTTILFVSHDTALVRAMCDKAAYLKNGTLAAYGTSKDICEMYQNDSTAAGSAAGQWVTHKTNVSTAPSENALFRIDDELDKKVTERSGSRELEVTAFDLYDMSGRRIQECPVGERVKLVISLAANADIPAGAQIGVLCRDERGNDIFTTNLVNFQKFLPGISAGSRGTVEWEFVMPVFGTFFFSMGIKPDKLSNNFYDRPFNAATLKTIKSDPLDTTGALLSIAPENFKINMGYIS
ncbi:MAG: ABC transporter ATP-binding protein [Lentisphaeria bacterium]|nr:ABC transporter ATP-binding protein [Lentisphaeria bacterium]